MFVHVCITATLFSFSKASIRFHDLDEIILLNYHYCVDNYIYLNEPLISFKFYISRYRNVFRVAAAYSRNST